MKKVLLFYFLLFLLTGLIAENLPRIKLIPVTVVGKDDPVLGNVVSVCEDDDKNFYILDSRTYKVHKFSPGGKLLLSFGRQGEGPGEMNKPLGVYWSTDGNLIVTEYYPFASIFTRSGKFIRKFNFSGGLGYVSSLQYSGRDLFYGKKMEGGSFSQVIFDQKGTIVNRDLFKEPNTSIPVKSGKIYVAYGFTSSISSPKLIFNYYRGHSAAAFSKNYEILVLDSKGNLTAKISRDIEPPELLPQEKARLKKSIEQQNAPDHIKRAFIASIPDFKTYFIDILISDKYVFVFRIPDDTIQRSAFWPVDLFTIKGSFAGTFGIKEKPIHITSDFMYFKAEDEEGNSLIEKQKYEILK